MAYNEKEAAMVTKKEILDYLNHEADRPIMDMDLVNVFDLDGKEVGEFYEILHMLELEGEVLKTKKGKYATLEHFNMVKGRMQTTQKGFGFVISDNPKLDDIFVPA